MIRAIDLMTINLKSHAVVCVCDIIVGGSHSRRGVSCVGAALDERIVFWQLFGEEAVGFSSYAPR